MIWIVICRGVPKRLMAVKVIKVEYAFGDIIRLNGDKHIPVLAESLLYYTKMNQKTKKMIIGMMIITRRRKRKSTSASGILKTSFILRCSIIFHCFLFGEYIGKYCIGTCISDKGSRG